MTREELEEIYNIFKTIKEVNENIEQWASVIAVVIATNEVLKLLKES